MPQALAALCEGAAFEGAPSGAFAEPPPRDAAGGSSRGAAAQPCAGCSGCCLLGTSAPLQADQPVPAALMLPVAALLQVRAGLLTA
jgi:hypothetical protein